jgi:hypothetical protein
MEWMKLKYPDLRPTAKDESKFWMLATWALAEVAVKRMTIGTSKWASW